MLFGKRRSQAVPQSYRPVMEASEVIDLFSRLTLHQQAALLRLISRNLSVSIDDDEGYMGYEFDWDVDGAMIVARPSIPEPQSLPAGEPVADA